MRVVLALGTEALTTKQIHQTLPDVAQASLYRAVSRLVDAGVITAVERHRRGGAFESVYRVADVGEFSPATSTAGDFAAAADTLARSLSLDAARHAAGGEWQPGSAVLLHESISFTPEQFELLTRQISRMLGAMVTSAPHSDSKEFSVTVAAIPRTPSDDGPPSKE